MEERLKINIAELKELRSMDVFCAVLAKKKLLSEEGARIVRRILKTLTKLLLDYMEGEERRKREREKKKYGL
ncbi:hypothetical protein [Bacteroides intestinalis]|uniref:Uncharacterized protein n=1 Tax=Bacteroides intestinalis TaxID=329854 RepID=A0A415MZY4_9BACE|nr:hypothetical protein [Bacteroides intestinalis]KAA4694001.1 hypothetical protein F3B37_05040 [Bacteroides intestinalis]KAA4716794.1 hypothetical protein F3B35_14145 [Bacteroides intestinalis]MBS5493566.1 hypothetical protein [Bacteroides intestinalis]MCB6676769.1 hypothetical protein [Bacteroides intestinalis]MCB7014429.1 hypothetical protein [Bacteroides intestinalis]